MNKYKPLNIEEIDTVDEIEWLIPNILPKGEPVIVYGMGEQFKSAVLLNMCLNLQEGRPVAGLPTKQVRVLWIALEGHRDIKPRTYAHFNYYGEADTTEIFFIVKQTFSFGSDLDEKNLTEIIMDNNIELLVVDTLSYATEGDISSASVSGLVTRQMRRMCDALDLTFVLIAHTGKDISRGIKGGSEFFNNMPSVLLINKGVVSVTKQRSSSPGTKLTFKHEIVDIGNGQSSICIVWETDQGIPDKYQYLFDYYDKLSIDGDVTKSALKEATYERFPDRTKDHHRTQFNRDLSWATETAHFEECFDETIKRNTSDMSETVKSVSADSLNNNALGDT